jgi:putative ABC transport system permease protein
MTKESFVMALHAIRASKLRSLLTLLGIVVGIFSIISVMTAVGVLKENIESGLSQLGANTFQVQKFSVGFNTTPEQRHRMWNRKNITTEQAAFVRERLTLAEAVAFEVAQGGRVAFWRGNRTNPNIALNGVTEEALVTNDVTVEVGRGLTADDVVQARRVIILGSIVAEKLFPRNINPVGEFVRIDKGVYQVIGVFAKKGSILGGDQNNFVAIPISTFFHLYGKDRWSLTLTIKAISREVLDDAIEQTRSLLRIARKVPPADEDDFGIFTNESLISQFNEFTFYLRLGVLVVSSIALLAAGVGIMNIMLVSVTERTREIGIRKAIGATKKDVLLQFIIEAVILCQIGGFVGVVAGIAGGNLVGLLVEAPAIIPWDWAAIGLCVCSLVGFVFGVYPAWKASALDPIEALRYE